MEMKINKLTDDQIKIKALMEERNALVRDEITKKNKVVTTAQEDLDFCGVKICDECGCVHDHENDIMSISEEVRE